jgi:uncharacterized protein YciI
VLAPIPAIKRTNIQYGVGAELHTARMQFIVYCRDKGAGERRAQVRARHLRHMVETIRTAHPYVFAGPLLEPEGRIVGSLFVIEAPDRAALDAILARDPYFQDGSIFETIDIHTTRQMVPEPIPGALTRELEKQIAKDTQ